MIMSVRMICYSGWKKKINARAPVYEFTMKRLKQIDL